MSPVPLFDRYAVVDWSAAATPITGKNSIWIAVCEAGARISTCNPPTRSAALAIIARLLAGGAERRQRSLIGFDFPFGYPAGTAEALGIAGPAWTGIWTLLSHLIVDRPGNANNRFAVAGELNRRLTGVPGPFWGCPRTQETRHLSGHRPDCANFPVAERRLVDRQDRFRRYGLRGAPQTVWKCYTAGSAGGQALTGIAALARMLAARRPGAPQVDIWPFTTGFQVPRNGSPVLAELYPTMFADAPDAGQIKDEAQVIGAVRALQEADRRGELAAWFGRPEGLDDAQAAAVAAEEGWMLGVP